jgi:hypothetical protein
MMPCEYTRLKCFRWRGLGGLAKDAKMGMITKESTKTTMMFQLEISPNCANLSELVKVTKPTAVVKLVRKVTDPMRLIMTNKERILLSRRTYS